MMCATSPPTSVTSLTSRPTVACGAAVSAGGPRPGTAVIVERAVFPDDLGGCPEGSVATRERSLFLGHGRDRATPGPDRKATLGSVGHPGDLVGPVAHELRGREARNELFIEKRCPHSIGASNRRCDARYGFGFDGVLERVVECAESGEIALGVGRRAAVKHGHRGDWPARIRSGGDAEGSARAACSQGNHVLDCLRLTAAGQHLSVNRRVTLLSDKRTASFNPTVLDFRRDPG